MTGHCQCFIHYKRSGQSIFSQTNHGGSLTRVTNTLKDETKTHSLSAHPGMNAVKWVLYILRITCICLSYYYLIKTSVKLQLGYYLECAKKKNGYRFLQMNTYLYRCI